MPRSLLFGIIALFALNLSAYAAGQVQCDRCASLRAEPRTPTPTTVTLANICYVQKTEGKVVLTVYLKDGTSRPYPPRTAIRDCFQIGLQWLNPATTGYIDLCNGTDHVDLHQDALQISLQEEGRHGEGKRSGVSPR